jgi:hypothetical protein
MPNRSQTRVTCPLAPSSLRPSMNACTPCLIKPFV